MRKYEILVVDDDPIILEKIGDALERKDYKVTKVNSGEAGIELLSTRVFDLVITDLVMGPVDGMVVLKKAKEYNADSMVIILTGYGDMTSAIDALRFNADDYILKPCEAKEIDLRVGRCLEKLDLLRKCKIYGKILPVCCVCKKIRDDTGVEHGKGKWVELADYLIDRAGVEVSHTYCPECAEKLRQEIENN